jgi:thioredoxin-like negative regulator of GroEL
VLGDVNKRSYRGVTTLTDITFSDFVRENRLAIVYFWAVWNGYDAQMTQVLQRVIPAETRGAISVGIFDTDRPEHWAICRELKVLNLPFLAFYRDGSLIQTLVGFNEPHIMEQINKLVAPGP